MPNLFAYLTLMLWPVVAIALSRRYKQDDAAILLLLVPFLFLPEGTTFDFPGIPPLDKNTIPPLVAFFLFYFRFRNKSILSWPRNRLLKILLLLLFIAPLFTYLNNTDPLVAGPRRLQGLTIRDFVAFEFQSFCNIYIPFILGWKILGTEEGHKKLLIWSLGFGLFYSILVLWEIRMSPQLHSQIYGFFPHDFAQQRRSGGFRAVVFQEHGLRVAILVAMWLAAAAGLYKAKDPKLKGKGLFIVLYLSLVLVLSKSMGSLLIGMFFVPLIIFISIRNQIKVCAILSIVVLTYPLFRSVDLVPVDWVITNAESVSEDRARSLAFRIDNEDRLLEKANDKRLFGWGTWGRNRVFNPVTGEDESVTDGYWVIILGTFGLFGYFAIFGLMVFPVLSIRKIQKKRNINISRYTCTLMVILVINMIDLIPNSSITNLTFLMAGALFGLAQKMALASATEEKTNLAAQPA